MAISMTGRERFLLIATAVLVVLWLLYTLGLRDAYDALMQDRASLRQAWQYYEDDTNYIRRYEAPVTREFRELEKRYRMGEQDSKEFRASTEKVLNSYGLTRLVMDPPRHELIEGLDDYGYLTLPFKCSGDVQQVARMLTYFDQQAILVKDLHLAGKVDSSIIRIEVTISQLVKLDEELKEKMKKQEKQRGLGSGQTHRRRAPGL